VTLKAMSDTRQANAEAAAGESAAIFERLSVVSLPLVPLP